GEQLHLAAHAHVTAEGVDALNRIFPMRPVRATVVGRAILEAAVVHLPNLERDTEYNQPLAAAFHGRSALGVPLLRDGQPIGAIAVGRSEPHPFNDKQIDLLRTFADQAVIAIENVRLFTELQEKNRALTEALDQQTATSEILRVISSSPTDMQPVFETIVRNAARLCSGVGAGLFRTDGVMLEHPVNYGATPDVFAEIARHYPMRLDASTAVESSIGKAILTRSVIQITDAEDP